METVSKNRIGDVIKQSRLKKCMDRHTLATALMVSEHTVADWENGRNRISKFRLLNLSVVLGLDVNELMELGGVYRPEKDTRVDAEGMPFVARGKYALCGDCKSWKSEKKRSGSLRYGFCSEIEDETERCDWCKKGL